MSVEEWINNKLHRGTYKAPSVALQAVGGSKWKPKDATRAREAVRHYFSEAATVTVAPDPRALDPVRQLYLNDVMCAAIQAKEIYLGLQESVSKNDEAQLAPVLELVLLCVSRAKELVGVSSDS